MAVGFVLYVIVVMLCSRAIECLVAESARHVSRSVDVFSERYYRAQASDPRLERPEPFVVRQTLFTSFVLHANEQNNGLVLEYLGHRFRRGPLFGDGYCWIACEHYPCLELTPLGIRLLPGLP